MATIKKYKNPQLYGYLKTYTQKAIKILRDNIDINDVPIHKQIKWFYDKDNKQLQNWQVHTP